MVDSAAISSHHRNESPDERTQAICLKHNVDISQHRARQIRADDWLLFDFVVALDENIYKTLIQMKPINSKAQVLLYAPPHGIHDPYFGGRTGFSKMYQDIVSTMPEFLKQNNIYSMQNSSISL